MKKFSAEFKLKVVKEYLEGSLSYMRLAKKYDSLSDESIKNWVKYYQKLGVEGLKVKPQSSAYSVQFKMDVLHYPEWFVWVDYSIFVHDFTSAYLPFATAATARTMLL